jgi:hypothetical protein
MKAIVADLLFSSILCCFAANIPVLANSPPFQHQGRGQRSVFLSAKILKNQPFPILPVEPNFATKNLHYSLDKNNDYINQVISIDHWLPEVDGKIISSSQLNHQLLSIGNTPISDSSEAANLILGFHNTFWPSQTQPQFWGLTAVELWGGAPTLETQEPKPNYANTKSPMLLPQGVSALTLSGGGSKNLLQNENLLGEFPDFRGGVAFHRGISQELTLGVGFIYEDLFLSFSQLNYQPANLPLQTTISLLSGEQGLELHSHIRFQPTDNFVINLYNQNAEQKFDLNWGIVSGLALTAAGNTKGDSLNAGINFSFQTDYFSLAAKAGWDRDNNWQWSVNSQFGNFHLAYASNQAKTNTELSYYFIKSENLGFECSLFFNYESQQLNSEPKNLALGGWRIKSGEQVAANKYRWEFDFGYGVTSQGNGIVASAATAITPEFYLKLTYQNVAINPNEGNWKVQFSSK